MALWAWGEAPGVCPGGGPGAGGRESYLGPILVLSPAQTPPPPTSQALKVPSVCCGNWGGSTSMGLWVCLASLGLS